MTPKGLKDTRDPTERPRDIDTFDQPLKEAEKYLATGYKLMKHATKTDWEPGNLLGDDGKDPEIMKKTITGIPWEERDNITDPRVGTSTGHIPVHVRPTTACAGWGGYDEFISWQAAGRAVRKEMVKDEKWNRQRNATVRFVDEDGNVTDIVENKIPEEHWPYRHEAPVPLYDKLHGQNRGFQQGPEIEEAFPTRKRRPVRRD